MSFPNIVHASAENGIQYQDLATSNYPLGQKMQLEDGRVFRHVLAGGTALVVASLQQGKAVVASDYTNLAVDSVAAVGDTTITFTSATTTAADYYNGGWLQVNKHAAGAGGDVHRIKSSPLLTSTSGDIITLEDNDPVRTAIAVSDEIGLTPNPYNGIIVAIQTTLTSMAVGVAVKAVTAAQYGWVQTRGMCAVNSGASELVVGNYACALLAAAGRVGVHNTTYVGDVDVGISLSVPDANGEFAMLYLILD